MIPYAIGTILTVASQGSHIAEEADAFLGKMRSRSGANLKYTVNDIRALHEHMSTYGGYVEGDIVHFELIDPPKDELIKTVEHITSFLRCSPCEKERKKVFNIIYAGHGRSLDGGWELRDETITGAELHHAISNAYGDNQGTLHVDLILDACYSSRFLIDFMVSAQRHKTVYPFDCMVSSLPEETSWEMDFLEHGAMSFHLTHGGNSYVDQTELAKAIDRNDFKFVMMALQGMTVPNPIALLTNGKQHAVRLTSGHCLEVQGAGWVELGDYFGSLTHAGIADALETAKNAYGEEIYYVG